MVHGARGSVPPSLPRARGVLPHSRESCASSNRTSRFKSENRLHRCSRRRESSGRRPDEYLAAVRRRRCKFSVTRHGARSGAGPSSRPSRPGPIYAVDATRVQPTQAHTRGDDVYMRTGGGPGAQSYF